MIRRLICSASLLFLLFLAGAVETGASAAWMLLSIPALLIMAAATSEKGRASAARGR